MANIRTNNEEFGDAKQDRGLRCRDGKAARPRPLIHEQAVGTARREDRRPNRSTGVRPMVERCRSLIPRGTVNKMGYSHKGLVPCLRVAATLFGSCVMVARHLHAA